MRHIALTTLVSIVTTGCADEDRQQSATDLLITNVNVVTIRDNMLDGPSDIFVQDGVITAIKPAGDGQKTLAETVIDGTGRYLVPGLIDSHTHLNEIPGMTGEHEALHPDVSAAARNQIPRSYLYHGFTTVIDLNSHPTVIKHWNTIDPSPRAYFCGAAPVVDGYPMRFMPKPVRYELMPYFLYDESRADEFPEGFDADVHLPAPVVARIHSDGAICVKTHYETGFGGRGNWPVPTEELIGDLVDAAHDRDLPVLLHANSEAAQRFGTHVGVDAFAHGMWTWADRTASAITPDVKLVVDSTIAAGIALQPTIQVLYGERDVHDPNYLDNPRLRQVLPASLIDWYRSDEGQWWRQDMLVVPFVARLVEEGRWDELDAAPIARVSAVLTYFHANGGRLLFGSDTPSDATFANPPGLNGRMEMDRWVSAGIGPEQILAAATRNNAEFFGLDDEIGSIDVGKRADLLLLAEDPLIDVSAYDSIEYVIVAGEAIERSSLSALSGSD